MRLQRRALWLVIILLAIGLLYILGPRVSIVETVDSQDLPQDLDAYLRRAEAAYSDIRPGTEKQIIWLDPRRKQQTPYSIIYLHGFSATRKEIYPVCDRLASSLGANLFYTRLTGHGRTAEAMTSASVNDWLNDSWEAWKIGGRIGKRVIVVGSSTGATLAAWLGAQAGTGNIAALILLSPNLGLQDRRSEWLLWPWAGVLIPALLGQEYSWEPINEAHRRNWTSRYPTRALLPMMGVVQLMRQTGAERITSPSLVAYSRHDKIIVTANAEAFYRRLGSGTKRLLVLDEVQDPQGHILAGEILSPATTGLLVQEISGFIRALPAR